MKALMAKLIKVGPRPDPVVEFLKKGFTIQIGISYLIQTKTTSKHDQRIETTLK